jgi:hypothetical protein
MRPALALERWMERLPTRRYSAHYLAVMRRHVEIRNPQPVESPPGIEVRGAQVVA